MKKLISIGECIVDILPNDNTLGNFDNEGIIKAGGAPANVCAAVASLNGRAYMLTKLSQDKYSAILYNAMKSVGIKLDYVVRDKRYASAIARISLDENVDRSFTFFRENTADLMLDKSDIRREIFNKGDILHYCSVCLVESPAKYAHIYAIESAKERGALISFDVNIRLNLYDNKETCINTVLDFLQYADIVKLSEEELDLLTENAQYSHRINNTSMSEEDKIQYIFDYAKSAKILFITRGKNGSSAYDKCGNRVDVDGVKVDVVDTTGAGDCYIASILYNVLKHGLCDDISGYKTYMQFASVASSMVCQRKGAMQSMPKLNEIKKRTKLLEINIK